MLKTFRAFSKIISSYKVTRFEQFGHLFKLRAVVQLDENVPLVSGRRSEVRGRRSEIRSQRAKGRR
jgi:hypothetical protein